MTVMKKILQAVLAVWLGVAMLVLAGAGAANAQSVQKQVPPGQTPQVDLANTDAVDVGAVEAAEIASQIGEAIGTNGKMVP